MKKVKLIEDFISEKKNSDLWSPYQKADVLAGDMFGAMGLFRLEDDELNQIIDLKKADKLAKKVYGEFGFKTLAAKEMEELLDKNPKLLRKDVDKAIAKVDLEEDRHNNIHKNGLTSNSPGVVEGKTISFSKASMMGAKILNKINIGTILDTKGGQYEITGYGQQSNAFKEFEAEKDGKIVKVKLTAMYGLKLEVTDDVRSARFNKEEEINSIILESLITEAATPAISVQSERQFGKKGIIIMIDDHGDITSAIFKDKKNADKYNRNDKKDLEKLLKLAKDTKYPQAIDEHEFDKKNWGQVASTPVVAETFSIFLGNKLNEGKWSKIMKGVRKGAKAGPWAIVSIENGKVVNQDLVSIMDAIPAHYEAVKKEFPNAKLSIEDNEGHIVYNESMINEKKHVAPKTYDNTKNWEKEGSRFRFIPFDDFKSRQVGKPDFKTPNMSDVEVEQWFTQISGQCDGRLQAKILKGFDKHGDKYKQSGDNMETYKSWIIDAMVRCGFMVEGKIQLPVSEKFYFGKKDKFNDNDINDVYGFYGTLDTLYNDEQKQEFWINTFNYLISSFGFTDEGALYFLNAKIGRWLADQFADSNVTMGNDGVFDVIDNFAKSSQWKRWAKEYNEFAKEDMTNESVVYETFDDGLNEEKSSTEVLADDVSGELYTATLKGKSVTVKATTTTKTWDDGVPVLKYLARGKGKPVTVELNRSFDVVHDVAHGWFYFTDGRKWFGMHVSDGYHEAEDLPFDVTIKESVLVKEAKMDRDDFIDHLKTKFGMTFVSTTEEFNGSEGGVWVSGESGDVYKGKIIYNYYSEDHKNYELGVLNRFEKQINKIGWYSEWYDAGTVMIWPL
jgi:hypothetical protein